MSTYLKLTLFVFLSFLTVTSSVNAGWFSKDIPIAVTFRQSVGGSSLVANFTNESTDKYLEVKVTYANKTLKQKKVESFKLGPKQTTARGWMEGWPFQSGETITLESAGYSAMTVTVP